MHGTGYLGLRVHFLLGSEWVADFYYIFIFQGGLALEAGDGREVCKACVG